MEKTIAKITKNAREEIFVALTEFSSKGTTHDMISARVFYDSGDGEMKPGRNGLNVSVRLLPALIDALQQAESEARAAGLLEIAERGRDAGSERSRSEPSEPNTIVGAG